MHSSPLPSARVHPCKHPRANFPLPRMPGGGQPRAPIPMAAPGTDMTFPVGLRPKGKGGGRREKNLLGGFKAIIVLIWKNSQRVCYFPTTARGFLGCNSPVVWPVPESLDYFGERVHNCKAFLRRGDNVCSWLSLPPRQGCRHSLGAGCGML